MDATKLQNEMDDLHVRQQLLKELFDLNAFVEQRAQELGLPLKLVEDDGAEHLEAMKNRALDESKPKKAPAKTDQKRPGLVELAAKTAQGKMTLGDLLSGFPKQPDVKAAPTPMTLDEFGLPTAAYNRRGRVNKNAWKRANYNRFVSDPANRGLDQVKIAKGAGINRATVNRYWNEDRKAGRAYIQTWNTRPTP